ncbi:hypothetical protein [Sphingobacterium sp. GVS05A]|uniref:hypothetical protein n=1 Tax=Sphingobacterium sp. GVS05A TaxID=2862679 RepID=UPI001CBD9481|nr:hypothetical protein [Sphingobacterium sp. GVS05A]
MNLADSFCKTASREAKGCKNGRLYGKMQGKTTERSRERERRNVDGGTGECRTVVDTLGADVMEKVDSWEKSVPERKEGG